MVIYVAPQAKKYSRQIHVSFTVIHVASQTKKVIRVKKRKGFASILSVFYLRAFAV